MRRVLILASSLAACGGGALPASTRTTARPADPSGSLPSHYAPLFVDGAEYRYQVTSVVTMDGERTESKSMMTCKVTRLTALTKARAAWLACDLVHDIPVEGASPTGAYVATEDGLWRLEKFPADAAMATLADDDRVVLATPREEVILRQEGGDGGEEKKVVRRADGAWCWSHSMWSGDDGSVELCFAAGQGLVGGSAHWGGGSVREITYERLP